MTRAHCDEQVRPHHTESGAAGWEATIRGLRISVAHIVNLVANGMTAADIVTDLPDLEEEDVRQALAYAAVLAEDQLHPLRG